MCLDAAVSPAYSCRMEIVTTFETLGPVSRELLKRCGARKGSRVTVELCEEVAEVRRSYRVDSIACSPDPMRWDSSWVGSDNENNSQETIAVWREAIALKYAKMSARSLAHYRLSVGLPGEVFKMIEAKMMAAPCLRQDFFSDPTVKMITLDLIQEQVG